MSNVNEAGVTSPELVLLAMMIENDYQQSEADKTVRDSARDAQREAMADELEAIEDQADAIRTGAMIQGSLTIAGGAMTFTAAVTCDATSEASQAATHEAAHQGATEEPSIWMLPSLQVGGGVATGLAQPMGDLFGRALEADASHDATAAAQEQEQASWVAEDAENHRQQVEGHAQAVMQQVQGILETQHQTTVAVLANV